MNHSPLPEGNAVSMNRRGWMKSAAAGTAALLSGVAGCGEERTGPFWDKSSPYYQVDITETQGYVRLFCISTNQNGVGDPAVGAQRAAEAWEREHPQLQVLSHSSSNSFWGHTITLRFRSKSSAEKREYAKAHLDGIETMQGLNREALEEALKSNADPVDGSQMDISERRYVRDLLREKITKQRSVESAQEYRKALEKLEQE